MASPNDNVGDHLDLDECSSFESFESFEDESNNSSIDSQSSHSGGSASSQDDSDCSGNSDHEWFESSSHNSDFGSSGGSSGGSSDDYELNRVESNPWLSGAVRIRNRFHSAIQKDVSSPTDDEAQYPSSSASNKKDGGSPSKYPAQQSGAYNVETMYGLVTKRSTAILIVSLVIWLYVQYQLYAQYQITIRHDQNAASVTTMVPLAFRTREELDVLRAEIKSRLQKEASAALGDAARTDAHNERRHFGKNQRKHAAVDKVTSGCSPTSWQMLSFPNCNNIHEIDLKNSLGMSRRGGVRIPADLGGGDKSWKFWSVEDKKVSNEIGYVGSGLWRQVWKLNPKNDRGGKDDRSVVLKVMKQEHQVDVRNFDRHRRDALVMERLTSSKNVVSVYSFCGNTILTEYAGITLDDIIYRSEVDDKAETAKEESVSTMANSTQSIFSTNTAKGRIHMALELMRGIEAIHEIPDGPIVHADLQSKQFLFHPVEGVKINDFNRCRFVPRNDETGLQCKIKIPSAPGANRSPEEYERMKIDEKIDIYSSANILFTILTGKKAWDTDRREEIAKKVMKGLRPQIEEKYRIPGTYDAGLADIIMNAYDADPKKRISAKQIVQKLENILGGGEQTSRGENHIITSLRRR